MATKLALGRMRRRPDPAGGHPEPASARSGGAQGSSAANARMRPPRRTPTTQELLQLVPRLHPDFRPVWEGLDEHDQAALARYFLPYGSTKTFLKPTRPRVIKWYCPFAAQQQFKSGHRYNINVFVGCGHRCLYCYAAGYEPEEPASKRDFCKLLDGDMADLERFDVPPAPVHLSNSTDPFQSLETSLRHTRYALEQILAHRHRFTTVTVVTKNPTWPLQNGYLNSFTRLLALPKNHPRTGEFAAAARPAFQVEVSLAFWRDAAGLVYDPKAPSPEQRKEAILALRREDIPVVLRIDPLFPRSPLPDGRSLADFGIAEAQTLQDLRELVGFAKNCGVRHVVYSPLKIVLPRHRQLDSPMRALRFVYQVMAAPGRPVWRGGSWRLPPAMAAQHVVRPFLSICEAAGVQAKFCMTNLVETP